MDSYQSLINIVYQMKTKKKPSKSLDEIAHEEPIGINVLLR